MVTEPELSAAVDAAFEVTGRGLAPWPHPHPDRPPHDDEYSRVSDPAKWRIVGARADAWLSALAETGLATVERDVDVSWIDPPPAVAFRTDRAVPRVEGALPLVLARSVLDGVDDAVATVGVGDPADWIALIPDCGCDACDSGSQDVLEEMDRYVRTVVSGRLRHLRRGARTITVIEPGGWRASGTFRRRGVDAILADPRGWRELSGPSWLAGPQ